jgi:hypothetical protein
MQNWFFKCTNKLLINDLMCISCHYQVVIFNILLKIKKKMLTTYLAAQSARAPPLVFGKPVRIFFNRPTQTDTARPGPNGHDIAKKGGPTELRNAVGRTNNGSPYVVEECGWTDSARGGWMSAWVHAWPACQWNQKRATTTLHKKLSATMSTI